MRRWSPMDWALIIGMIGVSGLLIGCGVAIALGH